MKKLFFISIVLCFILAGFQKTDALIVKYTVDELAARSELVIVGEVAALKARWNKDQEPIYTEITVTVDEIWKGNPETKTVTIEQVGGTSDGTTLIVPDAAEFKTGMKVILFIDRREDMTDLAGWFQGKFNIDGDMAIQEKTGYKIPVSELKTLVNQHK
ncbi:MAG: hypothetical protein A2161_16975 [Candidatus Schekmanbacteria bacterium RBG_13_48_7]|uniref:Uncharacterized protein n=1 Tax=Candidatus Schekmanbacteria bacterium RBG_13_48_7 TaxID=1817878 RepID=A0A1F7RRD5_9BACT|nr:MAG: hypothetical protein A2161_16975 [Candidatus Schekmanbacteria bacterium RBG_13_48_7]